MGIFDALTSAVSGLQSQSFALQNISGNIANSQTTGYKETNTSFQDLVSTAALGQQTAGSVFASSTSTNTVQGTIQNTTVSTDMAIEGDGYFVVGQAQGGAGTSTTQFSGVDYYTRRGDFQTNQNGYLVNGAGYYLMGTPVNPATGNPTTSTPQILQFDNNFIPAQATTQISYQANLASTPSTGPLVTADYTVDPTVAGTGTVVANDETVFNSQSLNGGSVTAYDAAGNSVDVQLRWAQTATSGSGNTWQLFYQTNSAATGTQVAWQNAGTSFTFNAAGQLTSPSSPTITLSGLTVNGDNIGNVAVNFGTNGLTQYASSGGTVAVNNLTQNGFAAGQLQSLSVDTQNQVVGSFSNGQTIALADITVATFNGENALQPLNGEAYAATPESGNPNYSATGKVVGSSLEASNVDIATQFSQLIVAQQAYSANARVMTTSNQMIQSLLQVIQ
jgi:flagellar hook protein FlgE